MAIKISECDHVLQQRIRRQIAREDAAKLHQPVARLPNPEREHRAVPPLERRQKAQRSGKKRVAVVVTIISVRNREVDDDNIIAGAKPLRDSIARSLALDDGDRRIEWEYRTLVTKGRPGTQVLITKLK